LSKFFYFKDLQALVDANASISTDPLISEIVDRMSNEADFSAGGWNFNIYGICCSCERKTV